MANKIDKMHWKQPDNPGGASETFFAAFAGNYGVHVPDMVIFPPKPVKFRKRW
jgi:hypothetical protein